MLLRERQRPSQASDISLPTDPAPRQRHFELHQFKINRLHRNSVDHNNRLKREVLSRDQANEDVYYQRGHFGSRESQREGSQKAKSKQPCLAQKAFPSDFFSQDNRKSRQFHMGRFDS